MKQEIADIRNAFDQEENKIPVKVESSLKKIEKSYDKLEATINTQSETIDKKDGDIDELYKESKKRQTKNQELERDIDTLNDEKDKILTDTKHEDYDELLKYKTDNEKLLVDGKKITRKQFIEKHEKIKDHTDMEKAKGAYTLPEDKDGKLDWTEVDDDAMVANMNKLKEQEGYGLFGDGTGGHGEPKGGKKGDKTDKKHYPIGTFK